MGVEMVKLWIGFGIAVLLGAAGLVRAQGTPSQCILQAISDFKDCKAQCKDDYRSAKFTCRGIDPACGKACLGARLDCLDGVEDILRTGQVPGGGTLDNCAGGTDKCRADLEAAKQACGAPCDKNPDPATCDTCVDAAQVTAFVCRDTCRESWRHNTTVVALAQQCKDTFKACVALCPHIQ